MKGVLVYLKIFLEFLPGGTKEKSKNLTIVNYWSQIQTHDL
jgi:hypothetical protein